MMRKLLFGLAALPFLASTALAGQPLNDRQMDRVVAGAALVLPPGVTCFGCDDSEQPAPGSQPPNPTNPIETLLRSLQPTVQPNLFTFPFPHI
jgi:hypothetical protein